MSAYLTGGDLAAYGVPTATAVQIMTASGMLDAYLARPEGLVFTPDFQGLPCYMAGLTPQTTWTLSGSIAPGANVVATITGGIVTQDLVGEVLIADRATPSHTEALVIAGIGPGANQVTFLSVAASHSSGALLDAGLVILEERPMPAKRAVTRVSRHPIQRLISGVGRYGYGRRSDQVAGLNNDFDLVAVLGTFGGPPSWYLFNTSQTSISVATSEIFVGPGFYLQYYSDVRVRYVAGYLAANVPGPVKLATAMLVNALANASQTAGNMKRIAAGDTSMERFANTILDADTQRSLEPFKANLLY